MWFKTRWIFLDQTQKNLDPWSLKNSLGKNAFQQLIWHSLGFHHELFTFEVVSNIIVDFSRIDLAAHISAFRISSFKSCNRHNHISTLNTLNHYSLRQKIVIYWKWSILNVNSNYHEGFFIVIQDLEFLIWSCSWAENWGMQSMLYSTCRLVAPGVDSLVHQGDTFGNTRGWSEFFACR